MSELSKFTTLPTIDGWDVIDTATGHAVGHRETLRSANGVAFSLNGAARGGPATLARALRAPDSNPRDPDVPPEFFALDPDAPLDFDPWAAL